MLLSYIRKAMLLYNNAKQYKTLGQDFNVSKPRYVKDNCGIEYIMSRFFLGNRNNAKKTFGEKDLEMVTFKNLLKNKSKVEYKENIANNILHYYQR